MSCDCSTSTVVMNVKWIQNETRVHVTGYNDDDDDDDDCYEATCLTCLQCLSLSMQGRERSGYPSMSVSTPHVFPLPAHPTLHCAHTHTHAQFSVFSCRSFSINTLWSWWLIVNERRLKPLSQAASSTHPAGNLSVPLHGAVGVGITGVKGQCSTRLPGEAARCLVTEETRFTASTLVWTLREDSTGLYLLQCYRVSTRGRCLTDTVWADCRSVW